MQTMAIRTVTNSLPENEVILLTLLISKRYIPYTDLQKNNDTTAVFILFIILCPDDAITQNMIKQSVKRLK